MARIFSKTSLTITLGALLFIGGIGAIIKWSSGNRVEVVHPTQGNAVQAVYATGTVEATVMIPIAPRTGARLIELNADEGSNVKKGDVLAQLEDEDLQQTLKDLQAKESFARKEYERRKELLNQNAISKSDFDRAMSDWESAKAAVRATQAQISYMKLLAPADGRIIRRDGEIGQLIPANQAVFWLSCCAPLRISSEVDEEDISLVQPGQKVLISADAFPGQIFHGKVDSITPKGDPVARSYRVRISFTEDNPLLIGMTAETNIITHEKDNALLVPTSAVVKNEVWVVNDGKLAQQAVKVGAKGPEQTEITDGLTTNDLVVKNPTAKLEEGQKIRTIKK